MKEINLNYKEIKVWKVEQKLRRGHSVERIAESVEVPIEKVEEITVSYKSKDGTSAESISSTYSITLERVEILQDAYWEEYALTL